MQQRITAVLYSSRFAHAIKRLPASFREEVARGEAIFRANCFDPRLKTHKLGGKWHGYWSFSLTYKHRVMFKLIDSSTVYFANIGDHSIYQ